MRQKNRRELLREATASAHRALEAAVGPIDSLANYRRYLLGLAAFRCPIEAWFQHASWPQALQQWRPTEIAAELRRDIQDLGFVPLPETPVQVPADVADLLGPLYVLEGSSLGAKLVYRDALQLGLGEGHGARHLAKQAASDTWRGFFPLLDAFPSLDFDRMAEAANNAFTAAHAAMLKVQDAERV